MAAMHRELQVASCTLRRVSSTSGMSIRFGAGGVQVVHARRGTHYYCRKGICSQLLLQYDRAAAERLPAENYGESMNIRKLQQGLKYRGRVEAVRQTYHVFEASDYFFVLSFSLSKSRRGSGYFNVVNRTAVAYVHRHLGGKSGVTAKQAVV